MARWLFVFILFHSDAVLSLMKKGDKGVCEKQSPGLRGKHSKRLVCCEHWEYDKDKKICKPQCLYSCGDAKCIAPNKCGCDPPLLYINKTCIPPPPKCDLQCINATCTFNNTCTCLAGHMHRDDYTCVPECSKSCINGDCVAPDTCHCHEGYKNKNAFECEPICNDCQNGVCVAPNTCTCDVGYVRQGGRCVPKCDYECINGFCSEPNTCTCHRGYEIDLSNGYTCRPMCDRECINATCSSPNTCKCLTGYMHANASVCKPLCESCINGECVAPNVCKCNNGYHMINGICEPYCSRPCLNGYCSGPESCTCDKGYELDNDNYTCRAVCSPKCINATCESPDRCKCFDGFIESSSFVCKPICSSCEHGKCISPTICMCNKGYNMIHGSCKPVCHHECVNGFCSRPNLCTCHDGYTRNSTHPSICSKSCIGCDNGTCIDGECTCKPGFNYINSTCTPMIVECNSCSSNCTNGECRCTDGGPCTFVVTPQRFNTVDSSTVTHVNTMAGLELSWLLGSCVSIVLLTGVIIIIGHMWRRQRDYETKEGTKIANPYGSVAYTVAGTLKNRNYDSDKIPNLYGDVDYYDEQDDDNETKEIRNELLTPHIVVDK